MADRRLAQVVHRLGWLCVIGVFLQVRIGDVSVTTVGCVALSIPLLVRLRLAAPTASVRRLLEAALVALVAVGLMALQGSARDDDVGAIVVVGLVVLNGGLAVYGLAMAGWADHLALADAARRYGRAATTLLAGSAVYLLGIAAFLALVEPGSTGDGWTFSAPHFALGRPIEGPAPLVFLGAWAMLTIVGDLRLSGASRVLRRALTQDGEGPPPVGDQGRASSTRL